MATNFGSRKSTVVCAVIVAASILIISSRFADPFAAAVAQDGGIAKAKPDQSSDEKTKDEGNADKRTEPGKDLKKFMRQKLEASSLILEGLCTEDLAFVNKGATTLMKMSKEENWRVSTDMMYRRYSKEFGEAVEELQKEAVDNDMDGTSLAWVNVTMKCLKCHEWVRNTILAESPLK